jgi:oxygen-independent coproporphyrinogen-3 oxidase
MLLYLDGHELDYEMQALCFAFFPGERVKCERVDKVNTEPETSGLPEAERDFVYTRLKIHAGGAVSALVTVQSGGRRARAGERTASGGDCRFELSLGRALYRAASKVTGIRPPWGILTGIRPVKLVRSGLENGATAAQIKEEFSAKYYISGEKIRLCLETAGTEARIIGLSRPDSASLYISLPFCPSRCHYCSFISHDVEKSAKLLPKYVSLLCDEIERTGELFSELSLRLETIYIGGGTPTALSAAQLRDVMAAVSRSFKSDTLREYTVEAGRPDTITREKLDVILSGGARRISINPQTLDDAVLSRIGRAHTAEDVYNAFALARAAKVPCINMDLIAGLPGDTPEGFSKTLDGVLSLSPEAITVHTLAMKRSSNLVTSGGGLYDAAGRAANLMLEDAASRFSAAGYAPYYLYRQKNTLGGLENVGYSKAGFEGLYNVFIMDETHSIISAGAGGVTKLRQPLGGRIERVFNFKYPYEYISRFDEIIARKKKVKSIYDSFRHDDRQIQDSHK